MTTAAVAARANPVLVAVTRGPLIESLHRGAAVVIDASGTVVGAWGDAEQPVYARSACKPLQAMPLVETGAAQRFGLSDAEIALACASHRGEPVHTETVTAWLARVGLSVDDLECGTHLPSHEPTAHAMIRAGVEPTAVHNNCSGKHSGFLTTAVHMGEPTRGYIAYDHPVQRRVAQTMSELTGFDYTTAPWGHDGCGIPTIGAPLRALALGMARLADPSRLGPVRAAAAQRVVAAMAAAPVMVSGTGTFTSRTMEVAGHRCVVKPGAEGVFAGAFLDRGLGIAIKVDDGTSRGAELAMGALLAALGAFDAAVAAALAGFLEPEIQNRAGLVVGGLKPVFAPRF